MNRDLPTEVVVEITASCNFSCGQCFNKQSFAQKSRPTTIIGEEYFYAIIDSISDVGIETVRLTGGEPLLHPNFNKLVIYAKKRGLTLWLNTNATLISKENISFIEESFQNVLVSFNGHDEQSDYQWTKTPDSFSRKKRGLSLLSLSKVPVVRVGTALTINNIKNIQKISEEIRSIDRVFWELYRPIPPYQKDLVNWEEFLSTLSIISLLHNYIVYIVNKIPYCTYNAKLLSKFCLSQASDDGHKRIVIDPRGFAKPSYYINEKLGDPRDILSCWNHPFMQQMRGLDFLPPECQGCNYRESCLGGSRFLGHLAGGSYNTPDPWMDSKNIN